MRHLELEQEFADGRAIESNYLLSEQWGVMLNADPILHCLRCLLYMLLLVGGNTNRRNEIILKGETINVKYGSLFKAL